MADFVPPDGQSKPGNHRGSRSGKVADFRYKRPSRRRKNGKDSGDKRAEAARQARAEPQAKTPKTPKTTKPTRPQNSPKARRDRKPASSNPPRSGSKGRVRGGPHNAPGSGPGGRARNGPRTGPRPGQAYGALDLGTNNCRLLIARPSGRNFTVIDAFSRVVKLGEGLARTGRLSDAAMDRALKALSVCADKLRRRKVYLARSVATEACRRAENGQEFIDRVRDETGIALDIISAREEARLAVMGCHILLEQDDAPAVIFDIGGGSTELALLEKDGAIPKIADWQSVPFGVVSLTDTLGRSEGDAHERARRYGEMRRLVKQSFAPFASRVAGKAGSGEIRLLGTSGTVTTLASVHLGLPHYDRKEVDGLIVPSGSMRAISGDLALMSFEERSTLPCIGEDRAELVVAGCAILDSILDIWPAEQLVVADRGIREGILRSLMATELDSHEAVRPLDPAADAR